MRIVPKACAAWLAVSCLLIGCSQGRHVFDDNSTPELMSWLNNDLRDGDPEPKQLVEILVIRLSIAVTKNPEDSRSWKFLGDTFLAIEAFRPDPSSPYLAMSEAAYKQALATEKVAKKQSEIWWYLADLYLRQGRFTEAIECTRRSVSNLNNIEADRELRNVNGKIADVKRQGYKGMDRYGRPRM
ncbi:MAG TPA: tetratricopeptide repeat protein [Fimbriimonadaceae bacterium]|nr:tetratricopeptide repeat protein [Fimbriimonadaceae bacterium]